MKRVVAVCVSVLSTILLGGTFAAAGDVDPTGVWQATRSKSKVVGACPMGGNGGGELTIEEKGSDLILTYGEGMTCRPAAVCKLTGSGSGGTYSFTTTVPVDEEGGAVTNSAEIEFTSATAASGNGSSKYVHPSGFSCTWTFDLALTR